jgi:hypothetical protein
MDFVNRIALAAALLLALSACATSSNSTVPTRNNPVAGYSFIHRDFDLRYAWNTKRSDSGLRVEGLVKNVRYPKVDNLEVKVMLVSRSHQVLAEGIAFPLPQPIDIGDFRSFAVVLQGAQPMPGDQLQFVASYAANAAQGSFSWTSNFAVDALSGKLVGPKESETEW